MMAAAIAAVGLVPRAVQFALANRRARLWGGVTFAAAVGFYMLVLPATDTGGSIGWVSLRWLSLGDVALSFVMATLLGLTTALGIYGLRQGSHATAGKTVLGAIVAVVPTLFCCSPILPIALTAAASILPAAGTLGLPIQGLIATHETLIYGIAIALMIWGLHGNARRALSCAC